MSKYAEIDQYKIIISKTTFYKRPKLFFKNTIYIRLHYIYKRSCIHFLIYLFHVFLKPWTC